MSTIVPTQRRKRVATYGKSTRTASYSLYSSDGFLEASSGLSPVKKKSTLTTAAASVKTKTSTLLSRNLKEGETSKVKDDVWDISSSEHEAAKEVKNTRNKLKPVSRPTRGRAMDSRAVRSPSTERDGISEASNDSRKRKRGITPTRNSQSRSTVEADDNGNKVVPSESIPHRPARAQETKMKTYTAKTSSHGPAPRSTSPSMPSAVQKRRRGNAATALAPVKVATRVTKASQAHGKLRSAGVEISDKDEGEPPPTLHPVLESATPQKTPTKIANFLPSTPPYSSPEGPRNRVKRAITTPGQKSLFGRVRDEPELFQSPSNLPITDLNLSATPTPPNHRLIARSIGGVLGASPKRKRLIDLLAHTQPIQSASPSSGDSSEGDNCDDDDSDVDMTGVDEAGKVALSLNSTKVPMLVVGDGDGTEHNSMELSQRSMPNSQSQALVTSGLKITYARDRSYLTEDQLGDDLLLETPLEVPQEAGPRQRKRGLNPFALRQKPEQVDELDDEDASGGMRSIHELRAAGGNRRFVNDFENIMDDLAPGAPSSMSRQRSAMMELCSKLKDSTYFTKISDHGFQTRLFERFANVSDLVLCFTVPAAVSLIVEAGASAAIAQQIFESGYLETVATALKLEVDVSKLGKERRNNMSKIAQSSVAELRAAVEAWSMWGGLKPKVISPRTVALKSLELLVKKLRESGYMDTLVDRDLVAEVVNLTNSASADFTDTKQVDADTTELCLSILEWESLAFVSGNQVVGWKAESIQTLATTLLPLLCSTADATDNLEFLAIRLLLNLTNHNKKNCAIFSEPKPVLALVRSTIFKFRCIDPTPDESTVNRLVLALGALINLAEYSDAARLALLSEGDQDLNGLLDIFLDNSKKAAQANSVEESLRNVATGYLAVALGNLCETLTVRRKVRAKLSGTGADGGLAMLVRAVEEFILYHQNVDKTRMLHGGDASEVDEGSDVWANHTERMRLVAQRLKMYTD